MKKVFTYLKDYQRKHFDSKLYLLVAVFLALCFAFNYSLDFEDQTVDGLKGSSWYWPVMFCWMAFPYLGISLILYFTGKNRGWISSPSFWIKIGIGFGILALDRTFSAYSILSNLSPTDLRFIGKCLQWSSSLIIVVLPLIMIYLILENDRPKTFYGLAIQRFDPKPYFVLLGIAVIFIGIGSFFSDIQEYYPRFERSGGERYANRHDWPEWLAVLVYEIAYGSDFVAVEVFFRGFLIHAFAKTLGGHAVLAMVGSYAFLHFGKPLTEAVSSVFGGYLLGIISYYTRNVWGGIIIHIGVAWAMEFFGYLQRLLA